MNDSELLLVIVVATALAFDFTNGFHDTANAMATSIATRALRPKVAVSLCAVLNFAGAFLSIKVAATISQGIVDEGVLDLRTLFAALVGAHRLDLVTWAAGLPSSSSHALIGGLIGAGLVAGGGDAIKTSAIVEKVIAPAVLAPLICGLVAIIATARSGRLTSDARHHRRHRRNLEDPPGGLCRGRGRHRGLWRGLTRPSASRSRDARAARSTSCSTAS